MIGTMAFDGMMTRVKSALLGDVARYSNSQMQAKLAKSTLRDMDRRSSFGRGYAMPEMAPHQAAARRPSSGLSLTGLYQAIRRIGEYDLERTR